MSRFVNQEQEDNEYAVAIIGREREIANYRFNERNYSRMLDGMSSLGDWPERLVQHKGKPSQKVAELLDDDDFDLWSQHTYRDQLRVLLRTSRAECRKVEAILAVLEASISEDRLEAALERVQATVNETN